MSEHAFQDQPELTAAEVDQLQARLRSLPRAAAPGDFLASVHSRIAADRAANPAVAPRRTGRLLPFQPKTIVRTSYAVAAAAAAVFFLYRNQSADNASTPSTALATNADASGVVTQPVMPPPNAAIRPAAGAVATVDTRSHHSANGDAGHSHPKATTASAPGAPSSAVAMHREVPPELLNKPTARKTMLYGGRLSTVSTGNPSYPGPGGTTMDTQSTALLFSAAALSAPVVMTHADSLRRADSLAKANAKRPRKH